MANVVIREATREDIPVIQRLYLQEEEYHRILYPDFFVPSGETIPTEVLEAELTDSTSVYLVATQGKAVVGFLYLKKAVFSSEAQFQRVEYASIEDCVVAKAARRQGIATALVEAAFTWINGQGIKRMQLQVWAKNAGAVRLYRKMGFEDLIVRMEWKEKDGDPGKKTT